MTYAARITRTAAVTGLLATVLLTGACSADERSGTPAPSRSVSPSSSAGTPSVDGSDAVAILDEAFTSGEKLGGGYGRLAPELGNTLASTPDSVLSVVVAFTCTGGATVTVSAAVDGKDVGSTAVEHRCDGSIVQDSVELSKPAAVGFAAEVKGSQDGSFAYAYYAEKKKQ
ncbi:hypothetical protein ACTMSW_14420 [Micromonospora sp. BQ11]|uniref:hypothetical protein n=1 Tax=Micromonospora sp. BQ11 TaxID=3452212 RepID=UPI003F8B3889